MRTGHAACLSLCFHMAPAVYALGVMLWEMVTREKPWNKLRHAVIAFRVAVERVRPPLPPPGPACPVALLALIERCWAHDPRARPSAAAVHAELAQMLMAVQDAAASPAPEQP